MIILQMWHIHYFWMDGGDPNTHHSHPSFFFGGKFLPLGQKQIEGLVTHKKDFLGEEMDPSHHTF
jgi:hypothetical protein